MSEPSDKLPGKRDTTGKNEDLDTLFRKLREGDTLTLSRAITLVESRKHDHVRAAASLVDRCLKVSGRSLRIGITGIPGAGKSSLINKLGQVLLEEGRKLAVLTIDPSSERSGGSILGDKTRMSELSASKKVFIRPSPSGGAFGGVGQKTREAILLCEAAGYDTILIESVGVGQGEVALHSMVDVYLVVLIPGGGDELQGIKRGIMEMADAILINKSEGENALLADRAVSAYKQALHLFPPSESGWIPRVLKTSALHGSGIKETLQLIMEFEKMALESGFLEKNRAEQLMTWFEDAIKYSWEQYMHMDSRLSAMLRDARLKVAQGKYAPPKAALDLFESLLGLKT